MILDGSTARLKHFSIEGLFGIFNHNIPIETDERITIIHAPNGFGKTIILKMIAAMFGGSLTIFRSVEFKSLLFTFDDGGTLKVEQGPAQMELFTPLAHPSRRENRSIGYRIVYEKQGMQEFYNPFDNDSRREPIDNYILRRLPHLRPEPGGFFDTRHGDLIDHSMLFDRYGLRTRHQPLPEWLSNLRSSIHCRLIETQRLLSITKKPGSYGDEPTPTLVVKTYAADLAESMRKLLASSATLAQSLDQTFPSRIMATAASEISSPPSEETLRAGLAKLAAKRDRLASAALLDLAEGDELISHSSFNDVTRNILSVYIDDTSKKLTIYDEMLSKLELFTSILNSRFQFKKIKISRSDGFVFEDHRGKVLDAEKLSSGEQHELVLLYDLLFRTKKGSLILIDEPEISLHVAWQRRFLPDLHQIISLTNIDAIVSTHSPALIADYIERAVILEAPVDE